jgi:PEP-CTERM motif-containing protein
MRCEGSTAKRFTLLVLLVCGQTAYADSVATFTAQTNIDIANDVATIDAFSTFEGPGISLNGLGNAICDWGPCGTPITPGSSLNPSFFEIDFGPVGPAGTLTLGGQQIVCQGSNAECSLLAAEINASRSITFPTNGQNFTVTVAAAVPQLTGSVDLFAPPGAEPFNIQGSSGELVLYFAFVDFPSPSYQFEEAVFSTPEPGALGLMAAGLAGVLGLFLSKRRSPAP